MIGWGDLGRKLWWETRPRFRLRLQRLLTGEYSRSSMGCCRLVEDYVFGVETVRVRLFKNHRKPGSRGMPDSGDAVDAPGVVTLRVFDINMAWWAGWRTKRALAEATALVQMWNGDGPKLANVRVVVGKLGPPGL